MADEISDEDRKLIDEAVAAGRVKRIPYGVRTLTASEFKYSELSNRLVYSNPEQAKAILNAGIKLARAPHRRQKG